jgi:hypothetical protein
MSRVRRSKNRSSKLAGSENPPLIDKLFRYGATFPVVPGLVRSTVSLAPSAVRTVLRYTRATAVVGAVGATATQIFSGNSLFDPDVTGAGGQPLGFDQWAAMYLKYRVLASSIEVNLATPGAASNAEALAYFVLTPSNDASAFTTLEAGASQPYAKEWIMNGISGSFMFKPTTSSMETALIMGVSKQSVLTDDELSALTTASPANQWYWRISGRAADSAATIAVQMTVTVSYLCDFYERNLLGLSLDLPKQVRPITNAPTERPSEPTDKKTVLREKIALLLLDGDV